MMIKRKHYYDSRQKSSQTCRSHKKGFSLMELVVVIAILAILAALVVPVLLRYTEDSRAQKDVSTMDEVVNAVHLAMADPNCYDEMLLYSCENNYMTYSDSSGKYGQQIIDAEYWAPDGCGQGVTITFNPEKDSQGNTIYRLENAVVNDMTYGNGSIAQSRPMEGAQLENNQCLLPNAKLSEGQESGYLYNKVKQTIGNSVITTSATYANSSFTVFIKFSQKDGVTVADVNGSFNGTNLSVGSDAALGSGTNTEVINPETGEKEQGEASTPDGGKNKNNYTQSALQGSGSMPGGVSNINNNINDYQQPSYVDNLQKEHKFEYYSSLALAAKDISANTIGQNADCDKPDAVAGIFVDQEGTPTAVVLKDNHEAERAVFKVKANVILGGHTLTYKEKDNVVGGTKTNICIDMFKGGTIDGRVEGSTLINASLNEEKTGTLQLAGTTTVNGGTYIVSDSWLATNIIVMKYDVTPNVTIKNATIKTHTHKHAEITKNFNNGIQIGTEKAQIANCTIDNCEIISTNTGGNANGVNVVGASCVVRNSKIICSAPLTVEGTESYGATGFRTFNKANLEISNCETYGNLAGVFGVGTAITLNINKSTISGYYRGGLIAQGCTAKIKDSTIAFENKDGETIPSRYNAAIQSTNATIYIDNSSLLNGDNAINASSSKLYISMCTFSPQSVYLASTSHAYLGLRSGLTKDNFTTPANVTETSERYNK